MKRMPLCQTQSALAVNPSGRISAHARERQQIDLGGG
jgi:hypothetical protein